MLGADRVRTLDGAALRNDAVTFDPAFADPAQAVVTAVVQPVLLSFVPASPNGRAMLVLGGGGYVQLMAGREGVQVARWLNALGYRVEVLLHRFPDAVNGPGAPLADARAAMRLLRRETAALGVVGLSSGGHLAACLAATVPDAYDPGGTDTIRPDVLVVGYAPISTNAKGRTILPDKPPLVPVEKQAMYDLLQPDVQLLPDPPPLFLVYAGNDPIVPVDNARRLHAGWTQAGGVAEMHVFADAPHGFALDTQALPVSVWPQLCAAWLRQVGFG